MFNTGFSKSVRKRISVQKEKELQTQKLQLLSKTSFENELNRIGLQRTPPPYYSYKLTHKGIISYKTFENYSRKIKRESLSNLINYSNITNSNDLYSKPFDENLGCLTKNPKEYRRLDKAQQRKCKTLCSKLSYYSGTRKLLSRKSGKYQFKVGFITLTAPSEATDKQILEAFNHFLDYLRRTAACIYVWKKELGTTGKHLHFHILVNNIIPYYIVSWKWKRLLIAAGVQWSKNVQGKDTSSHYRVEIPKNSKQVSSYIAKYMSKENELPLELGYIWGYSNILKECKETVLIEGEIENNELWNIYKNSKMISTEFVCIACIDLLKIKTIAPMLYNIFYGQYLLFTKILTLPQKFQTI